MQLREGVVLKVTVTFPVEVTASEKLTVASMTVPAPYDPDALVVVTEVIVGAVVSGIAEVVTEICDESAETFPATSTAETRKVYAVLGERPVTENVADVGVPRAEPDPFWKIRYPETPEVTYPATVASVEGVHVMSTLLCVTFDEAKPEGTDGAVTSGRLIVTGELAPPTFPAASFAHAYNVFVPGVAKVCEVGALAVQLPTDTDGVVADSLTRYPVTPPTSTAESVVIGTVRDYAVVGMTSVTTGAVVSTTIVLLAVMFVGILKFERTFVLGEISRTTPEIDETESAVAASPA